MPVYYVEYGIRDIRFNSDGCYPTAGLILSGNTLFRTTYGTSFRNGAVLHAVNTDGTGFTNLYIFSAGIFNYYQSNNPTNSDGAFPKAALDFVEQRFVWHCEQRRQLSYGHDLRHPHYGMGLRESG